jgi:hypothetical protein
MSESQFFTITIAYTTYMSYTISVKFKDFQDRNIELSESTWEHIRGQHPEISIEDIRTVLTDPLEVRECQRQNFVELFYRAKANPKGKIRFHLVVVKVISNGNFISTAMTTTSMKNGRTLYKKEGPK